MLKAAPQGFKTPNNGILYIKANLIIAMRFGLGSIDAFFAL
jgi:hypothetical protein